MGRISDTTANVVLDLIFGSGHVGAFSSTYNIALSTTQPTNTGTNVTEPSGNGYARVAVANDDTHWPPAASRQKANAVAIIFPQPTGAWGLLTHFAVYDGVTFRGWGALRVPRTIDADSDPPEFDIGALIVSAPGS